MVVDAASLGLTEEQVLLDRRPIEQTDLHRYAWASGDYNPIHYSEVEARKMGLPGVICHGMLTLALMSVSVERLVALSIREKGVAARVASLDTRFVGMVQVGDKLSVSAKIYKSTEGLLWLHLYAFRNGQRDL